jgi:Niemann-Pick C1 protein
MGSSVFQGVTATKLVGVIVLGLSESMIFRVGVGGDVFATTNKRSFIPVFLRLALFQVYYYQMYFFMLVLGFLHGLVLLPIFLSIFGTERGAFYLPDKYRYDIETEPIPHDAVSTDLS